MISLEEMSGGLPHHLVFIMRSFLYITYMSYIYIFVYLACWGDKDKEKEKYTTGEIMYVHSNALLRNVDVP